MHTLHWTTLVEPAELNQHLGHAALRVVDCRFELGKPHAGRAAWQHSHLPEAVFADLEQDLSAPISAQSSRHPLPEIATLSATLSHLGIDADTQVVVYDTDNGAMAARLWWLLRWLGHERVAVLNGGFKAWQAAGLPVTDNITPVAARNFVARPRAQWLTDASAVRQQLHAPSQMLIDARAPERYAGTTEPLDPVAGHIPGARNHFFARNLDTQGRFLPAPMLREHWQAVLSGQPATHVVCYCGSGVTACHNLLALEIAGLPGARLYAGSWSEWCKLPQHPVATGHEP